jgi:hypothetical protein
MNLSERVKELEALHANAEEWIAKQQAALVASAKEKGELLEKIQKMGEQLDALLAHCPDAECIDCGLIICPHGDALHFHHDGCPSCVENHPAASAPLDTSWLE